MIKTKNTLNDLDYVYKTFVAIDSVLENYKVQYVTLNMRDNSKTINDIQEYIFNKIFLLDTDMSYRDNRHHIINHILSVIHSVIFQFQIIKNRKLISQNNIDLIISYLNKCEVQLSEYLNNNNSFNINNENNNIENNWDIFLKDNFSINNVSDNSLKTLNTSETLSNTTPNIISKTNPDNIKDIETTSIRQMSNRKINNNQSNTIQDTNKDIYKTQSISTDNSKISSIINSNRREAIYKVLQTGEVSIKDISKKVKACSEKTILRELLFLIDNNLVSKTGERRWARYKAVL